MWESTFSPSSNPADLIRNLISPCEAAPRHHPTDLTPLHTALSMLSPIAHGNQRGNKAWTREGEEGEGCRGIATLASTPAPPGASLGKGFRETPSRSMLIDEGGNYISLAFSANPHGAAG